VTDLGQIQKRSLNLGRPNANRTRSPARCARSLAGIARWFLANLFKLVATIRTNSDGFASEVFLIHRRDTLRATKIMAERALHHPKDTAAVLNDRVLQATCNYQPRVRNLFWRLPLQKYRGGGDTEWRSRLQPCVKIMSASERRR
jgi:hypothetical protein